MARNPIRRPDGSSRMSWAVIGITAFVALDIVLVAWAVASVRTPPQDPPVDAASRSQAPQPTSTTPATPTATTTPTATPDAIAPKRVLAVFDANTAWRANTGACPATNASLQLTTDGGKSWKTSDASGPTGASSPVRILATSDTEASVVTLNGQGCAPEFIRTYVAGDNWATYDDQLTGTWFVNPRTPSTVHSPNGDVKAPCKTAVGLAVRDSAHAAVLCSDHRVYRTTNTGAVWGKAMSVAGAVAISADGTGYVAAATHDPRCSGVLTSSFNATSGAAEAGGCLKTAAPAGEVAIASGGGALWLWAGTAIAHSTDGGMTWR